MLRSLLAALAVALLSACSGASSTAPEAVGTRAESVLSYEVRAAGDAYPFVVSVTQNDIDGIGFRFDLADGQTQGSLSMNSNAIDHGTIMVNRFTSRAYMLTDKTSVWLAREPFAQLRAGETVGLDLGQGTRRDFSGACGETYTVGTAGGDTYTVPACRFATAAEGAQQTLIVADDAEQPLILSMNTGLFEVSLQTALPASR
ncbi:MAG: hypothetical protein AAFQ43_05155 [Bacteroidota bacterium]